LPFKTRSKTWQIAKIDTFKERFNFHICHRRSFNNKVGRFQKGYVERTFPFSYLPLTQFQQQSWQITKKDTFKEDIHFHIYHS